MAALIIKVDKGFGFQTPGWASKSDRVGGYNGARAHMAQVSGSSNDIIFRFPYAPVEVTYDNLSSEYEEIKRPTDYSFIARKGPQLARVSFQFRVANRASRGYTPIVKDLELLRAMALGDSPVSLVGMGDFLFGADTNTQAYKWGTRTQTLYRIMEMGINVVQRSPDNNDPTQADCSVTLIEDRNPIFNIVTLPKIEYQEEPPTQTSNNKSNGNGGKSSGKGKTKPAPKQDNSVGDNYTDVAEATKPPASVPSGGRGRLE